MIRVKLFSFSLYVLVSFLLVKAQNDGGYNTLTSGQSWNEVDLTHALSTKFITELDLSATLSNDTLKRGNILQHFTQFGARGWLHYYVAPRLKLSYGFGYWNNPSVPEARQSGSKEFRSSTQLIYYLVAPRITFLNRLRYEDRFLKNNEDGGYNHSLRLWYGPKLTYCLNSRVIRKKTVYLILGDEVFVVPQTGYWIDINRVTTGIGYSFTSDTILEIYYSYQRKFNFDADQVTNAIGMTLTINNVRQRVKKE